MKMLCLLSDVCFSVCRSEDRHQRPVSDSMGFLRLDSVTELTGSSREAKGHFGDVFIPEHLKWTVVTASQSKGPF